MRCPTCGDPTRPQPVFKHRWWVCSRCGDAWREPRSWVRVDAGAAFFDPGRYTSPSAEGTPYAGEVDKVLARLDALGVDRGGRILDLSGGPGFVARRLMREARQVVMTDYAAHIVTWARDKLGVDARRFDYDGSALDTVVTGPFDLVLCRYSLNFCLDLPRLLRGLGAVSSPDATFVLDGFLTPTRGACLTSAVEDLAPRVLWTQESVSSAFAAAGWRQISAFEPDPPMPYWTPRGLWFRLVSLPWELAPGPLPRDPYQRHAGLLFRRSGP